MEREKDTASADEGRKPREGCCLRLQPRPLAGLLPIMYDCKRVHSNGPYKFISLATTTSRRPYAFGGEKLGVLCNTGEAVVDPASDSATSGRYHSLGWKFQMIIIFDRLSERTQIGYQIFQEVLGVSCPYTGRCRDRYSVAPLECFGEPRLSVEKAHDLLIYISFGCKLDIV